jgi:hypothetical protein
MYTPIDKHEKFKLCCLPLASFDAKYVIFCSLIESRILNLYKITTLMKSIMLIYFLWIKCELLGVNLVIFPRPAFNLPILCVDVVIFPNTKSYK